MKIASWNVNGIRAAVRKDAFVPFLKKYKPDVLGIQEIKMSDEARENEGLDFDDYNEYYNPADKSGYAGTATFVSENLNEVPKYTEGIGGKLSAGGGPVSGWDSEGRVQTTEFKKFFFVNAYFPMTRDKLERLDFKIEFDKAIAKHAKKLDKKKPVIFAGDYNVAHEEIDLARPKANDGKAGFHPRERDWMSSFLDAGFIDTFRYKNPKKVQYSYWSQRAGARARNVGWRVDYLCVSKRLEKKIKKAQILDQVQGSDHAPLLLEIDLQ